MWLMILGSKYCSILVLVYTEVHSILFYSTLN